MSFLSVFCMASSTTNVSPKIELKQFVIRDECERNMMRCSLAKKQIDNEMDRKIGLEEMLHDFSRLFEDCPLALKVEVRDCNNKLISCEPYFHSAQSMDCLLKKTINERLDSLDKKIKDQVRLQNKTVACPSFIIYFPYTKAKIYMATMRFKETIDYGNSLVKQLQEIESSMKDDAYAKPLGAWMMQRCKNLDKNGRCTCTNIRNERGEYLNNDQAFAQRIAQAHKDCEKLEKNFDELSQK